jgi:hypothetical protein
MQAQRVGAGRLGKEASRRFSRPHGRPGKDSWGGVLNSETCGPLRTVEIIADGNVLRVDEIHPRTRELLVSPQGFRWLFKENLNDVMRTFLPHAHIEIESVKVSEPK